MNRNYFYITVTQEHRILFYGVTATLTDNFDAAKQFQYREDAQRTILDNHLRNAAIHELCSI